MKTILKLVLVLLIMMKVGSSQQIVSAEYFFDSDPGIGNGIVISIGTAADSVEVNPVINTSGLGAGFHRLVFRFRDQNNVWSISRSKLIYLNDTAAPVVSANPVIKTGEYFFDADHGPGNGVPVFFTAGDSASFNFVAGTGALSPGFHRLSARIKDANNVWGMSKTKLVYVYDTSRVPSSSSSGPITAAEYFYDNEPGTGNGIPLAITPGDSIVIQTPLPQSFPANTGHRINVRVMDSLGNWSFPASRNFVVCDSIGVVTAINGYTSVAACLNQNGIIYSIDTVLNADFYVWNIPPGAIITSGDSTTVITVNYSPYSSSGFVTVAGGYDNCIGVATFLHVNFKPIPVTEICRATIDSLEQKTIIEWQKPAETYVDGYVIYREIPPGSGNYLAIASVPDTVFSSYLDTGSHPNLNPEKYKIAVLDSCGNIGDISAAFNHQTINLYGSIQPGGLAKLYWNDYVGINDSTRYFNLLRDTTGSGAFTDTIVKHVVPAGFMNGTDPSSASYPLCRYVVEMVYESNCTSSLRSLLNKSTSRSNIKNKTTLFDSTSVGINPTEFQKFDFTVYPNPVKEILTISNLAVNSTYEIYLYNSIGKCIWQSSSGQGKNKAEIRTAHFAKGLYLLKITSKQESKIFKIQLEY